MLIGMRKTPIYKSMRANVHFFFLKLSCLRRIRGEIEHAPL